ncbi:hypothetical protein ACHAWU_008088 [Discostella pseudostelligera]|uniref:Uncharacterized protein n=1 Tax=Discostella pseudostelligera TaxID=259834 RepID=A0ABD3N7Q3_9STRA
MSSTENAPAAAPRRGKFLSAPAPSFQSSAAPNAPPPPSQTRGKFLGKIPATSATNLLAASTGSSAGDADHDSIDNLRAYVHSCKVAAASRRKLISAQRQTVIDDMDAAENIVLSLLDIASDVAGALSDMTTAKSKKRHEERSIEEDRNVEDTFEDLTAKVRSSGAVYLAGVKCLHKLLAPHSNYVKSLNKPGGEDNADDKVNSHNRSGAPNNAFSKIVAESISNMHAVRVKQRLAIERCEILREMIRLHDEETRGEEGSHNNDTGK